MLHETSTISKIAIVQPSSPGSIEFEDRPKPTAEKESIIKSSSFDVNSNNHCKFLKMRKQIVLPLDEQLTDIHIKLRSELPTIQMRISRSRGKILKLHERILLKVAFLKTYQKRIALVMRDLLRLQLQMKQEARESCAAVRRFDYQRNRLIGQMTNNVWNKKKCFYMSSIEHFNGNGQTNRIINFAATMPGKLAVLAVANQSVQ